jgi:hypothetical protein
MNASEFEAQLRADGFDEVKTGERAGNDMTQEHAHDFEVRALVLDGDITLTCEGTARTYKAGDVFVMAAGRPHEERIGTNGVRYVAGRKHG